MRPCYKDWHGRGTNQLLDSRSWIPRGSCCQKMTGTFSFPRGKFLAFKSFLKSFWWWSCHTSWNKPSSPSPLTWVTRFIILLSFCIKCSITSPKVEKCKMYYWDQIYVDVYIFVLHEWQKKCLNTIFSDCRLYCTCISWTWNLCCHDLL